MQTITDITNGYNVESFGGYCAKSKEVIFRFPLFEVHIFSDGSVEIRPVFSPDADVSVEARKSVWFKSHYEFGETLSGVNSQPDYTKLAYDNQDEFTEQFANAEHAALHIWIDTMREHPLTQTPATTQLASAIATALLNIDEATHAEFEELFVTNIQLLANGVQPTSDIHETLNAVASALDLHPGAAVVSALSFVNFLRGYLRKEFNNGQS